MVYLSNRLPCNSGSPEARRHQNGGVSRECSAGCICFVAGFETELYVKAAVLAVCGL